jgi:hypothetical protein
LAFAIIENQNTVNAAGVHRMSVLGLNELFRAEFSGARRNRSKRSSAVGRLTVQKRDNNGANQRLSILTSPRWSRQAQEQRDWISQRMTRSQSVAAVGGPVRE